MHSKNEAKYTLSLKIVFAFIRVTSDPEPIGERRGKYTQLVARTAETTNLLLVDDICAVLSKPMGSHSVGNATEQSEPF